jgi:Phasin protein
MTKETHKGDVQGTTGSQTRPFRDYTVFIDASSAGLNVALTSSAEFWSAASAMGQEMTQFAAGQLRQTMELPVALTKCADPREAFEVGCNHARMATQQFLDEASKIVDLEVQMSQRCLAPFQDLTKETFAQLGKR